jgi:type IV pilus assembly protein PilV
MHSTCLIRRQRGLTMVESLVALVVLSTGMLGIASLYVASLRAERNALVRTQAVYLVSDMVDRIRANAVARSAYDSGSYAGGPADKGCVTKNNCSTTALAEDDLHHWIEAAKKLPGYRKAEVTFTAAASAGQPDDYRVRVEWMEAGDAAATGANAPSFVETLVQIIPVTP